MILPLHHLGPTRLHKMYAAGRLHLRVGLGLLVKVLHVGVCVPITSCHSECSGWLRDLTRPNHFIHAMGIHSTGVR